MALCVALPHLPCLVCTQMETDLTVLLRTLRLGTTVNPRSSYVSVIEELSSLEAMEFVQVRDSRQLVLCRVPLYPSF